jgi:hypothetical protein
MINNQSENFLPLIRTDNTDPRRSQNPCRLEKHPEKQMSPETALVKMYFFLIDSQATTSYTLAASQDVSGKRSLKISS